MATNWSEPSRDYPSREEIAREEREDAARDSEKQDRQRSVARYLLNHPSSSLAEAEYRTRGG